MDRIYAFLLAMGLIMGAAAAGHAQQGVPAFLDPDRLWDACISVDANDNAQDPFVVDVELANRCEGNVAGELAYVAIVNGQRAGEGTIDLSTPGPHGFTIQLPAAAGAQAPLTIVFHGTFQVSLGPWGAIYEIPVLHVEEFTPAPPDGTR